MSAAKCPGCGVELPDRGAAARMRASQACWELYGELAAYTLARGRGFLHQYGVGHDYGPHHEGLREALYRSDRRVERIFAMLKERGLFDSTLFVLTSDHGMAPQKVELKANPACEPAEAGLKGVFAEPMIYLRDLAIECERARDLRSLRVIVRDNDHLPDGENPPVAGAAVVITARDGRTIAEAKTPDSGRVAFPTPADLSDRELTLRIEHRDFNSRTIYADGTPVLPDLRRLLYG